MLKPTGKKSKLLLAGLAVWGVVGINLAYPSLALAEEEENTGPCGEVVCTIKNDDVMQFDCLERIYCNVYHWAFYIAGTIVFIYLLYGGFLFLTSAGDEEKISTARKTITWAVAGVAIVVATYALLRLLQGVISETGGTKVSLFNFTIVD